MLEGEGLEIFACFRFGSRVKEKIGILLVRGSYGCSTAYLAGGKRKGRYWAVVELYLFFFLAVSVEEEEVRGGEGSCFLAAAL